MKKIRGFEKTKTSTATLPIRSTKHSAGYDFYIEKDMEVIPSLILEEYFTEGKKSYVSSLFKPTVIATGVKAYMQKDEVLKLYLRSSLSKSGLRLPNSVGIIDSDYYNNETNEGEIHFMIENTGKEPIILRKGTRIGQGVFQKFLITDNDNANNIRKGGIGST